MKKEEDGEEEQEEAPKLYEVIRADHDYIELLVKVWIDTEICPLTNLTNTILNFSRFSYLW